MFARSLVLLALVSLRVVSGQAIWNAYQTTSDQKSLFKNVNPSTPIKFGSSAPDVDATISIDQSNKFQTVHGYGASLTDSSAKMLDQLKKTNVDNYWKLMKYMFDATVSANAAGFSVIRVPLGASDSSASEYSFDDNDGDSALDKFSIDAAPAYLYTTLKDITSINPAINVLVLPWSPPGWMKDSGTMKGGSLKSENNDVYAQYLLKSLQGYQAKNISVFGINVQNEPQNSNPSYPTCSMSADQEAAIAKKLKSLLTQNKLDGVKIIGYEHNWDNAMSYPVNLMAAAPSAFDGVSFHGYAGNVKEQMEFAKQHEGTNVFFTEVTGTIGSDWWTDIKWQTSNVFLGAINAQSQTGMTWLLAADESGGPMFPGTNSCGGGCRPVATIKNDGTYTLNQEFYAMAQTSKAVLPKDQNGPAAQRISANVDGGSGWALTVSAFETARVSKSAWLKYSMVVMNWNDNGGDGNVKAAIEFNGNKAVYNFPVGLTTLWWYAPPAGSATGASAAVPSAAAPANSTTTATKRSVPLARHHSRMRRTKMSLSH